MKKPVLCALLAGALLTASLVSATTAGALDQAASSSGADTAATVAPTQLPPRKFVGFYVPDVPWEMAPLSTVEGEVGFSATFSNYFQNVVDKGFAANSAASLAAHGTIPMVTLEFYSPSGGVDQSAFTLKNIAGGATDTYLHKFARDAKAFGHTMWLRPFHEMNGNWYPWCGTVNTNSPADFAPAWRHVHDIFTAEGATNVKFVWCPNIDSHDADHSMSNPANTISSYWPGDAYVDYIALDGYNFGTDDNGTWRSFTGLFSAPYNEVTSLSADKPVLVAETSCATRGGSKAAWIADMFRVVPASFPRIAGIGWFNTDADRDWRVDSSADSLAAFRSATHNSTWSDLGATSLTIKRSTGRAKRGRAFYVSGTLRPGKGGDAIRVYVRKKGGRWAAARATCDSHGNWRYRSRPKSRGTYYYYAKFATATTRWGSTSKTVAVTVR